VVTRPVELAKIAPPLPRGLDRERLYKRLDALAGKGLVWIEGPAGSGKTTLAAAYLRRRRRATLWYRVDEGDGPGDLFHYLTRAARRLAAASRRALALPVFRGGSDAATFARRFFAALFRALPDRAAIVLDDLPAGGGALGPVLRAAHLACPPGRVLVVTSRGSVPPALARAAVHDEIGALEPRELGFTVAEIVALVRARPGRRRRGLGPAAARRVLAATGGWAAAVSLLLRGDLTGAVAPPDADAEHLDRLFDYLSAEILAALDPGHRALLNAVFPLPSFTAADAAALAGDARAEERLASLDRAGLFVERLAARAEAEYRLHALVQSFLERRALADAGAAAVAAVKRRAAGRLRAGGRPEEAFALYAACGDVAEMAATVAAHAPALASTGRLEVVARWLAALPPDAVAGQPWLRFWAAVAAVGVDPAAGRRALEELVDEFEGAGDAAGAYGAWATAVEALVHERRSLAELPRALERLARLQERFPDIPSAETGAALASALVIAVTLSDQDRSCLAGWTRRAGELLWSTRDAAARFMLGSVLIFHFGLRGELGEAQSLLDILLGGQKGGGVEGSSLSRVANATAQATLAWMRGDTVGCAGHARAGLTALAGRDALFWKDVLLVCAAFSAIDQDRLSDVERCLEEMAALASSGRPFDLGNYHFVAAWRAFHAGDLAGAAASAALAEEHLERSGFSFTACVNHQLSAQIAFARGDREAVARALGEAVALENQQRHPLMPYWRSLAEAHMALADGDAERCAAALRVGLGIGRERGVFGALWPDKAGLAALVAFALERGIEPAYARELARRRRLVPGRSAQHLASWPHEIKILTLGGFRVLRDDDPVVFPLKAQRIPLLLLKHVVALGGTSGRTTGVGRIVDQVWPDAEADSGVRAFEVALSRLRTILGNREVVRVQSGRVGLDPRLCWVDLPALESLLDAPPGAADAARAGDAAQAADRILGLYAGRFLGDDDEAPLFGDVAARLQARLTRRLLGLYAGAERDRPETAAAVYFRAVERDAELVALRAAAERCWAKARGGPPGPAS
jgi:ATP/maltotriose-dependent transcriptional regulator MalT/DNA-binding SARP family transcriptional activator